MAVKEIDLINELRQTLYTVFQENGVTRAIAYVNKDRTTFTIDNGIVLMVESGLKGLDFCVLLDKIYSLIGNEFVSVIDITHFGQWSDIDNVLALEGTEIYCKETSESKLNQGYLKEIQNTILKVQKYCNTDGYENFAENSMLIEACEYNLRLISQLADYIDEQFKKNNPQIPWDALNGFRWRLTSTLAGANKSLLWEIIKNDFPKLLEVLEFVIRVEKTKEDNKETS